MSAKKRTRTARETRRERQIASLSEQIQREAALRIEPEVITVGMNETETGFFEAAVARGFTDVARSGWPDFIVRDRAGRLIAIEVKSVNDRVSERQAVMFTLLEQAGLPVFVWWSKRPDVLTPWRNLAHAQVERLRRHVHIRPSFRIGGGE